MNLNFAFALCRGSCRGRLHLTGGMVKCGTLLQNAEDIQESATTLLQENWENQRQINTRRQQEKEQVEERLKQKLREKSQQHRQQQQNVNKN